MSYSCSGYFGSVNYVCPRKESCALYKIQGNVKLPNKLKTGNGCRCDRYVLYIKNKDDRSKD